MLELPWVEDSDQARNELARPLMLWERCSGRTGGASPFDVCVRPRDRVGAAIPFAAWEYRPAYLPELLAIHVASGSPVDEPLWFYLGFGGRPDRATDSKRQPPEHPAGLREVTGVRLTSPVEARSDAMAAMVRERVVTVQSGSEHRLELTFDGGRQGRRYDFRTSLPLIFRW